MISRKNFFGAQRETVAGIYPVAVEARMWVMRDLNCKYLQEGKGAAVNARFGKSGITIVDPNRAGEGKVFESIYAKPI